MTDVSSNLGGGFTLRAGPNMAVSQVGLGIASVSTGGVDAQTAVAGAATSASPNVIVTSEALTTATAYTLTLTDALIVVGSVVQVVAYNGVATGVQVKSITVTAGQVVIVLGFASYSGALTINVSILN